MQHYLRLGKLIKIAKYFGVSYIANIRNELTVKT